MSNPAKLEINPGDPFPHLANAPIVEAVISVTARAQAPWEELAITQRLKHALPEYPKVVSRNHVQQEITLSTLGPDQPNSVIKNLGWLGLVFQSADDKHIAQFTRDGFSFHRLQPYEDWEKFSIEAMRLWRMHADLAQPLEIQRAALRFINRIEMQPGEIRCEEYIKLSPQPIEGLDLPFMGFFHQDTLAAPGHPLAINVIRTIQPPQTPNGGIAIILDIDASTTAPFQVSQEDLAYRLQQMRWLKNKVFFGNVTGKALNRFK
jgi:uncharacterized protein (TIGR04255 family)